MKAPFKGGLQLAYPALQDAPGIELTVQRVPPAMIDNLDLAISLKPAELRERLGERCFSLGASKRLRCHPHTELVRFEPGLEIRDECVDQVGLGGVELAEVGSPGYGAYGIEARVAHRSNGVRSPQSRSLNSKLQSSRLYRRRQAEVLGWPMLWPTARINPLIYFGASI